MDASPIPTEFHVFRPLLQDTFKRGTKFRLQGCYPLRRTFPCPSSLPRSFVTPYIECPTTPKRQASWFGLSFRFRSPLLREIAFAFSSLRVLRCFSSLGPVFLTLCIQIGYPYHYIMVGFPIRKSSDQSLLTAPEAAYQALVPSFIDFLPGVHRAPFLTLETKN